MNNLDNTHLTTNQSKALSELKRKLLNKFDIKTMILYGSVTRGEADEESDLDLLIVTAHPLSRTVRHKITDLAFDVNLLYEANISTLVVDYKSWEEGVFLVLPLREEILKDGILL